MAPASALQDRIKQFEAMDGGGVRPLRAKVPSRDRPRPSYPPVPRVQASFVNSEASGPSADPMGDPISPTAASYTIIKPTVPYVPRKPRIKSPSPSPPNLGCNTSLIDLKDSRLEERAEWFKISKPAVAPPLPPRISSQNSGASGSMSSRSWSPQNMAPGMQSRTSSNSLTVEHTYPPLHKGSSSSNSRQRQGHVPASSTSSFHSVSLSSDGDAITDGASTDAGSSVSSFIATYPMDSTGPGAVNEVDRDRDSVDDSFSFETVSSTDMASPTLSLTHEWEKDFATQSIKPEPPKLPSRRTPLGRPPSSPSPLNSPFSSPPPSSQKPSPTLNTVRRVPPPPPSRFSKPPPPSASSRASLMSTATSASDRSSIFSTGTVTTAHTSIGSCTQLLRPTPVPVVARKRYEAVFFANVNAQRRVTLKSLSPSAAASPSSSNPASPTTPRKGWRGISVDLVTNPEENPIFSTSGDDVEGSRLEGQVVKTIWSRSKLLSEKLRDIWNECAFPGQTSLDKDGFVKGMWRIDEELRRVQSMRSSTMTTTSNSRPSGRTTTGSLLH